MKKHGFSKKIISRVEKTQKLDFIKIPTLHTTTKPYNFNESRVVAKDNRVVKVKKAKVFLRKHNFSKSNQVNGVAMALHELRENVIMQHDPKITEKQVHKMALKWKDKDINFAKR